MNNCFICSVFCQSPLDSKTEYFFSLSDSPFSYVYAFLQMHSRICKRRFHPYQSAFSFGSKSLSATAASLFISFALLIFLSSFRLSMFNFDCQSLSENAWRIQHLQSYPPDAIKLCICATAAPIRSRVTLDGVIFAAFRPVTAIVSHSIIVPCTEITPIIAISMIATNPTNIEKEHSRTAFIC